MKLSVLKHTLVFAFLINMFVLQAFSNNGLVSDKKFLIQQGLSQSRILCILEDERGFMWFGTADGLNRYDGYKMKIFKHRLNDTTYLPNNTIASMVEDSDGNFWIATYNGVALFNPYSETCRTFIETDTNLIALGANKLTSCAIDHQQNIWFGTNGFGVFKMNAKTLKREYFFNSQSDSLKMNDIQSVFVDSKNRLWMGYFFVDTLSVYQIDQDTLLKFSVVRNENAKDEAYRNYSFYEDADQRIWTNASEYVHGNTELFYCENGESTFRNYKNKLVDDYDGSNSTIAASITSITGDKEGQLYAASLSGGVFKFRFGEAPTPYYTEDELKDIPVVCIYIGKNNLIWVGTNGYGVVFSYPKYTDFNLINNVKNNSFKVVSIRAFMEDENHYWVGGYDGLVRMSKNFNHIETVYNSNVYSIANHTSDPNFLWLGSEGDGLILFDKRNAKNTKFNLQIPGKNYSRIKYVYTIQHISATKLLVGGSDGLVCINPITGSVKEYPYQGASKIAGAMSVRSINTDREGNILIGYINGLIGIVDFENETVEKFTKIADLRNLSYYDPINCIYHDEQHNYWIASSIGLIKYDAARDTLIVFSEKNGLPNSHLYGILPDDDNNLWMSTNNGLSCYVIEENIFKNFDVRDGLQNNEFNTGAYFKAANGFMFFGGISGVNYFNPFNIRQNSIQPAIQITDIRVNNQYLTLSKEQITTRQLEIQPDEEIITIDFSGLSFINNNKNKYKYKINELNKDWIDLGNYHQITFNNLAPGKYTLEILASNNHGLWLNMPYAFSIVVLPTFFESVFFKWLIGILILIFIFVGIQLRMRQLIKQKKQLQLFADKQTESLVATNDTLKNVIKELKTTTSELEASNKTKEKFLSIIAHDLMGPLGVIEGFSDMLNKQEYQFTESEMADYIETINTSAKGLISLLSNLLHWSRLQRKSLKINPTAILLKNIIDETVNLLQGNIKNKEIELSVHVDKQAVVLADYNMLSTILRNLISNAVKFTSSNGKIIIDSKSKDQQVVVSIADTGVGIADEILSKLFNPEEFVTTKGTNNESGTGLGLNLVSEFVTLNKGIIEITSQVNVGTTFYLTFPKPMPESENSVISS